LKKRFSDQQIREAEAMLGKEAFQVTWAESADNRPEAGRHGVAV
jgi:hypothetical protein